MPVEESFGTVLVIVVAVAALLAVISYIGSGALYKGIGKSDFFFDSDDPHLHPKPESPQARAEAQEELRQLVEAKSHRRVARGQAPLDVDAEVAALSRPPDSGHDAALREEVRQLVVARNERRARKGQAPLDVEAEVERQLSELG
jgi:hypothetical protein